MEEKKGVCIGLLVACCHCSTAVMRNVCVSGRVADEEPADWPRGTDRKERLTSVKCKSERNTVLAGFFCQTQRVDGEFCAARGVSRLKTRTRRGQHNRFGDI